jgi:hypothetical protein
VTEEPVQSKKCKVQSTTAAVSGFANTTIYVASCKNSKCGSFANIHSVKTKGHPVRNAPPMVRFRVNIASYPRVLEESFRCLLKSSRHCDGRDTRSLD